jgi:hypothetical protein
MWRDDNQELPPIVRDIKRDTEELIRLSDKAFLKLCKVAWDDDIEHPFAPPPDPEAPKQALRRKVRDLIGFVRRRLLAGWKQ